MNYLLSDIAKIIRARAHIINDSSVEQLLFDSRKIYFPSGSLFFAIQGKRRDGHDYIAELYALGVKNFVVSRAIDSSHFPEANFLHVENSLMALQELAAHHRKQFSIPVIGITGSNGKTIVKEWLYQLLHDDYSIVRSPKSYNSQIGVAISVWQMNEQHNLGIFEAGISQPGEMEKLARMIQPTIGIITNIGEAHSEGFPNREEKEKEKRILLEGTSIPPKLEIVEIQKSISGALIQARNYKNAGEIIFIEIPLNDDASVSNAISCWELMLFLDYDQDLISTRMRLLTPVNMRLELKAGINHCTLINDSYSADLSSLDIALNFLEQQSSHDKRTVILSDFLQSSLKDEILYKEVMALLKKHEVQRLIGIGERISTYLKTTGTDPGLKVELHPGTAEFIHHFRSVQFKDETILIKGARDFRFEEIVQLLELKAHQTILEINLNSIVHNLKEYQQLLHPSTKIMAMVKAFAYGSGGAEIAGILQFHKVDYLGVAYADEGVELRKAGIDLPMMVMNPDENAFEIIVEHKLEPELYSFGILTAFEKFLEEEGIKHYPVHIEIETGMNRLGFSPGEMEELANRLNQANCFIVQSVFSHLAASEDREQDDFTRLQFQRFENAASVLQQKLNYKFTRHIANSAAVIRHQDMQLGMVRLGIGLYGVDSSGSHKLNLEPVATLKSTIAQVKQLKAGDSVSYNRKTIVGQDSVIATIRMGYADGYPRRLGNGIGKVWLKGQLAPVIGTVCMDMFMIDITGIEGLEEGDEVIIFGKELPVELLARDAGTIPYEIMTGVSQRVKRVYFAE